MRSRGLHFLVIFGVLLCSCHSKKDEDLTRSASEGDLAAVDRLLRQGADPNAEINDYTLARFLNVVAGAFCLAGIWWICRKRGFIDLEKRDPLNRSQQLISRIHDGADGSAGVCVLRCPDAEWQPVVGKFIDDAEVVVLDASFPSENLIWEAGKALARHSPDSLIFTYGVWAGEEAAADRPAARLREVVGTDVLERYKWVPYSLGLKPEVAATVNFKRWRIKQLAIRVLIIAVISAVSYLLWMRFRDRVSEGMGLWSISVWLGLTFVTLRLAGRVLKPYHPVKTPSPSKALKALVREAVAKQRRLSQADVRRRRTRSVLLGLAVCLAFYTVVLPIEAISDSIRDRSVVHNIFRLFLQDSMALGPFLGFLIFLRRADAMVLWLRRFHQTSLKTAGFQRLLAATCMGTAKPVTIQDTTFKTSFLTGFYRNFAYLPFLTFGMLSVVFAIQYVTVPFRPLGSGVYNGNRPLVSAASSDHPEVVDRLLRSGADPNAVTGGTSPESALYWAASHGNTQIIALLLARSANPNVRSARETGLDDAYIAGHLEAFRMLLKAGADPNFKGAGSRALGEASAAGDDETVKALLDAGANPNLAPATVDEELPLERAIRNGHKSTMELLLSRGSRANGIDAVGRTPLLAAVERGDLETAGRLLRLGADPNTKSRYWGTPLQAAAKNRSPEMARLLLVAGANPNLRASGLNFLMSDDGDVSPLHVAYCDKDTIAVLIGNGADPNVKSESGFTAFHKAVENDCSIDILSMMLQAGANPNTTAIEGRHRYTPAFWAWVEGDVQKLKLLLDHGAAPDVGSEGGKRPKLFTPSEDKEREMELLLQKHHSAK